MLEIWFMEYEDARPVEMDGEPVVFDDHVEAEKFLKIFNLHRTIGDHAWIRED